MSSDKTMEKIKNAAEQAEQLEQEANALKDIDTYTHGSRSRLPTRVRPMRS